jgi:hypothetical protein
MVYFVNSREMPNHKDQLIEIRCMWIVNVNLIPLIIGATASLSRVLDGRPRNRCSVPFQGQESLLFSIASTSHLGPIQPHIQWVPAAVSPGVKRQGREADHSPISSAELKNGGAIPSLSHTSSWRGV